ncbi:beta-galactosidase 8-like [Aristolochia californica]|uniref:beta-galactosidase 8-like n=1 Tax=Aristolochia californica TaxID=171875 RepID=UPI0035DA1E69
MVAQSSNNKTDAGSYAIFLANIGTEFDAAVSFKGTSYHLPSWYVSTLPNCQNVVLNTTKSNSQTTHLAMKCLKSSSQNIVGSSESDSFPKARLLKQINTTTDVSDYLWYSAKGPNYALHAFVNGKLAGNGWGDNGYAKVTVEKDITLALGRNIMDFLSATVGLQHYGAFFDTWGAEITSPIKLRGINAPLDLSSCQWMYQPGLKGEGLGLSGGGSSQWISCSNFPKIQPSLWYKTNFDASYGNDPIAIDFTGMGKGTAWVNGQSMGHSWATHVASHIGCDNYFNYSEASHSLVHGCNLTVRGTTLEHLPHFWRACPELELEDKLFLQWGAYMYLLFRLNAVEGHICNFVLLNPT